MLNLVFLILLCFFWVYGVYWFFKNLIRFIKEGIGLKRKRVPVSTVEPIPKTRDEKIDDIIDPVKSGFDNE